MEKEREENIRRKKIFCLAEEKNNGEGKGGKHLEKEKNVMGEMKNGERAGGKYLENENVTIAGRTTNKHVGYFGFSFG